MDADVPLCAKILLGLRPELDKAASSWARRDLIASMSSMPCRDPVDEGDKAAELY